VNGAARHAGVAEVHAAIAGLAGPAARIRCINRAVLEAANVIVNTIYDLRADGGVIEIPVGEEI